MRRFFFFATFFSWSFMMQAQNKGVTRSVLYTLGKNEKIFESEYSISQKMNKKRFACIVIDDDYRHLTSFVFNGKKFSPLNEWRDSTFEGSVYVEWVDVNQPNGHIFYYTLRDSIRSKKSTADRFYINYKGIFVGPFDDWNQIVNSKDSLYYLETSKLTKTVTTKTKYEFSKEYTKGGIYPKINGKRITAIPIDKILEWDINEKGKYIFSYRKKEKVHVNINGQESDAYDYVYSLQIAENGSYAYCFQKDNKYYVQINGINSEPYDDQVVINLSENDHYGYVYKKGNKYFVNVNGKSSTAYDYISSYSFILKNTGNYGYVCRSGMNEFVSINGNLSSAFDGVYSLNMSDNGNYIYLIKKETKWHVNINGVLSNAYEDIYSLQISNNKTFIYGFKKDKKYHVNLNGKISSAYDDLRDITMINNGKYAYIFKKNGQLYINQNGIQSAPFYMVDEMAYTEKDGLTYSYSNFNGDGKVYSYKNGNVTTTNQLLTAKMGDFVYEFHSYAPSLPKNRIRLFSTDKTHSFEFSWEIDHVIIDGKKYGRTSALHGWYDAVKNTFIWNAVEGKQLVLYEYKL